MNNNNLMIVNKISFIVSAFYGEHPNKQIFCTGYIWTKSKFLGLSIGVEMVGQGKSFV